jgi:hypothetical protein
VDFRVLLLPRNHRILAYINTLADSPVASIQTTISIVTTANIQRTHNNGRQDKNVNHNDSTHCNTSNTSKCALQVTQEETQCVTVRNLGNHGKQITLLWVPPYKFPYLPFCYYRSWDIQKYDSGAVPNSKTFIPNVIPVRLVVLELRNEDRRTDRHTMSP